MVVVVPLSCTGARSYSSGSNRGSAPQGAGVSSTQARPPLCLLDNVNLPITKNTHTTTENCVLRVCHRHVFTCIEVIRVCSRYGLNTMAETPCPSASSNGYASATRPAASRRASRQGARASSELEPRRERSERKPHVGPPRARAAKNENIIMRIPAKVSHNWCVCARARASACVCACVCVCVSVGVSRCVHV